MNQQLPHQLFSWLHLSDLHAGMGEQGWLWPTLKHLFFDDISRVFDKTGPWDAVIFSGDLTQSGSPDQFKKLDEILSELWQQFRLLGTVPTLICVPGNHDLSRPSERAPIAMLLKRWWSEPTVREEFWEKPEGEYREAVAAAFKHYTDWWASVSASGIPTSNQMIGCLPGDFSTTVTTGAGNVGIVGLNSTWLQLGKGDYDGNLLVHPRQLNAVTQNDPDAWGRRNSANFLVTHHPVTWLSPGAVSDWEANVNPPGRFDVHLFGHMHVPDATSNAHGGSAYRRSIQGASLFGLEEFGGTAERIHGFSAGKISASPEKREIRIWPRRLTKMAAGHMKLAPDLALDLDDNNSFVFSDLGQVTNARALVVEQQKASVRKRPRDSTLAVETSQHAILEKVRYFLAPSPAHANVRRVEQRAALASIADVRTVWIASEWGAGADGFIWSLQQLESQARVQTYQFDMSSYTNRDDFLSNIKSRLNINFEQFCEAASSVDAAYLILDDIPVPASTSLDDTALSAELEDMIAIILQYCPGLRVILRSRHEPYGATYPIVVLKPLDEADLRQYLGQHEKGGQQFLSPDAVSVIYRHTDGVPARVDVALRELEVITIEELSSTDLDLNIVEDRHDDVPKALAATIVGLTSTDDPIRRRAFDLLRALSTFPQGESLERLKRFYGPHPVFPVHARELMDSALLVSTAVVRLDSSSDIDSVRLLVVPRTVRDYVRSHTSADEIADLSRKAAELYFGDKWNIGRLKPSAVARFANPMASNAEISNANVIILRLLYDSISAGDERGVEGSLEVATAYLQSLTRGDHFRSVATFCKDLIPLIPLGKEPRWWSFRFEYARSLRMLGKYKSALEILQEIVEYELPTTSRQQILLSLAMTHESLKEITEAVSICKTTIKIDKNSHYALQATAIVLEHSTESSSRAADLARHEALCRKKGAHVVANNLALSRADDKSTPGDEVIKALDSVIKHTAERSDFYNGTRAIIKKAEALARLGSTLSEDDEVRLINAYHFLLSERLQNLFNLCHDALWNVFDKAGETANLFRLFRQSSLIWRLRGDDDRESRYLKLLAEHAGEAIVRDVGSLDREVAYYLVRASQNLAA